MTIESSLNCCVVIDENNSRDSSALENSQRMYPFKKRKFFNQTSSSASDRGSQCHGIFDSSDTKVNGANHGAGERMHHCLLCFLFCNLCSLLGFRDVFSSG